MVDKISFDYVISASSRLRLYDSRILEKYYDQVKPQVIRLMEFTKDHLKRECKYTDPKISVLYNGFVEAEYPRYYKRLDNLACDYVYADSGGLQIITLGKTITPELKAQIYKDQEYADYAMCFDEIALERTTKVRNSVERLITDNKIFNEKQHILAGEGTGRNIKEQINHFRNNKSKTKVILIVQGNNCHDMLQFFRAIASQLTDDDYNYIGGMALADTCMGNGALESVEMLKAAREIGKIAHESIRRHLHFLGVGTINRMRPIIYLLRSGYLSTFHHISYDSSTVSSAYDFGKVILDEKTTMLGQTKTSLAVNYFTTLYDFYGDIFKPLISLGSYIDAIFGIENDPAETMYSNWKNSSITLRVDRDDDINRIVASLLVRPAYLYYQIADFILCVDKAFNEKKGKFKNHALSQLLDVKDDANMIAWEKNHSKFVQSKRIRRKEDISSFGELF